MSDQAIRSAILMASAATQDYGGMAAADRGNGGSGVSAAGSAGGAPLKPEDIGGVEFKPEGTNGGGGTGNGGFTNGGGGMTDPFAGGGGDLAPLGGGDPFAGGGGGFSNGGGGMTGDPFGGGQGGYMPGGGGSFMPGTPMGTPGGVMSPFGGGGGGVPSFLGPMMPTNVATGDIAPWAGQAGMPQMMGTNPVSQAMQSPMLRQLADWLLRNPWLIEALLRLLRELWDEYQDNNAPRPPALLPLISEAKPSDVRALTADASQAAQDAIERWRSGATTTAGLSEAAERYFWAIYLAMQEPPKGGGCGCGNC